MFASAGVHFANWLTVGLSWIVAGVPGVVRVFFAGRNRMEPLKPHHAAWLQSHPNRTESWFRNRITEGFDVHHLDGDHENNVSDNLILIESQDHMRLHGAEGFVRFWTGREVEADLQDTLSTLAMFPEGIYRSTLQKRLTEPRMSHDRLTKMLEILVDNGSVETHKLKHRWRVLTFYRLVKKAV
jgi:hypothetical protein